MRNSSSLMKTLSRDSLLWSRSAFFTTSVPVWYSIIPARLRR